MTSIISPTKTRNIQPCGPHFVQVGPLHLCSYQNYNPPGERDCVCGQPDNCEQCGIVVRTLVEMLLEPPRTDNHQLAHAELHNCRECRARTGHLYPQEVA